MSTTGPSQLLGPYRKRHGSGRMEPHQKRQKTTPNQAGHSTIDSKGYLALLPTELRQLIWDAVGKVDDYDSLLRTDQRTRCEILSRLPGGILECAQSGICQDSEGCNNHTVVDEITIMVDPDREDGSWLKIRLAWAKRQTVWKVRDINTNFLALTLFHYRAKRVTVEFHPPTKGFRFAAFLVLRAKLFDVGTLLGRIQFQPEPTLQIRFCEPPSESRPRWRKPFWENRTLHIRDRTGWVREPSLTYWAQLAMPLILHPLWRNAAIIFDDFYSEASSCYDARQKAPKQRTTQSIQPNDETNIDHGMLSLFNWAYCQQLIGEHKMPRPQCWCNFEYIQSCCVESPFDGPYADLYGSWAFRYSILELDKLSHSANMRDCLESINKSPEGVQLRSAIQRLARLSPRGKVNNESSSEDLLAARSLGCITDWPIASKHQHPVAVGSLVEGDKPVILQRRFKGIKRQAIFALYDRGEGQGEFRWMSNILKSWYLEWALGNLSTYMHEPFTRIPPRDVKWDLSNGLDSSDGMDSSDGLDDLPVPIYFQPLAKTHEPRLYIMPELTPLRVFGPLLGPNLSSQYAPLPLPQRGWDLGDVVLDIWAYAEAYPEETDETDGEKDIREQTTDSPGVGRD